MDVGGTKIVVASIGLRCSEGANSRVPVCGSSVQDGDVWDVELS